MNDLQLYFPFNLRRHRPQLSRMIMLSVNFDASFPTQNQLPLRSKTRRRELGPKAHQLSTFHPSLVTHHFFIRSQRTATPSLHEGGSRTRDVLFPSTELHA